MTAYKKSVGTILALILITGAALAYVESHTSPVDPPGIPRNGNSDGLVRLDADLSQTKVLMGSDGKVSMALRLAAATLENEADQPDQPVDLVVVLDRSGSMNGQKINDARRAILNLLNRLTTRDRLALVTYSNHVRIETGLLPVDGDNRTILARAVNQVSAGGGTNLGGGLKGGIDTLLRADEAGRQRKVILISDGLANQGITDPHELGRMASIAVERNFSISSVGVGYDFNEVLMTALADRGAGRYYFLENPQTFVRVFEEEFQTARQVAAAGLEVRIPQKDGLRLIHAGGYPISYQDADAVFHPGDLLSGQERNLFLTFEMPADREGEAHIETIRVRYRHQGWDRQLDAGVGLKVACVPNPAEVAASVDETTWSRQVLQEDYGRLKAAVADAIRKGERDEALAQIQEYEDRNATLNDVVGSSAVTENLEKDIRQLEEDVKETFAGEPAAVSFKRKQRAKTLQYDSYQIRRDQKK